MNEQMEIDPENMKDVQETEFEKAEDKILYTIGMNEKTGFLEILPMNSDRIVLHGENEARFFIDLILDHFQTV